MPSLRIGLTGGIGSGKSLVASRLGGFGAAIVDVDVIARSLTVAGGSAMPAIAEAFGSDVIDADGALDRVRMRELAFGDDSQRLRLEQILHPLIGAESERQASVATADVIVFDIPLLAESGRWRSRVDYVLVVDCSKATQASRVAQRSGWSSAMVDAVIARQASRAARRACADAVLYNEGIDITEVDVQLARLWQGWLRIG